MAKRKKVARTPVMWRPPTALKDAAQLCADTIGQSLSQFISQAVAQRIRNWRDPLSGKPMAGTERGQMGSDDSKWDGWLCIHGSHEGALLEARDCPHRDKKVHQDMMVFEATGQRGWRPPSAEVLST